MERRNVLWSNVELSKVWYFKEQVSLVAYCEVKKRKWVGKLSRSSREPLQNIIVKCSPVLNGFVKNGVEWSCRVYTCDVQYCNAYNSLELYGADAEWHTPRFESLAATQAVWSSFVVLSEAKYS